MHRNLKLALIYPVHPTLSKMHPPLSVLMLAEYLIANRILPAKNIRIFNTSYDDPETIIPLFKPDIIGFSVLTSSYPLARQIAANLKKITTAPLIIGGYHISGVPHSLERPFDLGVAGEGEETLVEIINLLKTRRRLPYSSLTTIPNLIYFNSKNQVQVNPLRPLLQPHRIPRLNLSLVPEASLFRYIPIIKNGRTEVVKTGYMFTARGCPYKCKFCAAQVMWPGKSGFRLFPVDRVGEEISTLYHRHQVRCIHIWDDTFAVTKQRLRDLTEELRRRGLLGRISFTSVYVRANLVDAEFIRLLKDFGTVSVYIGFESGSENMLGYLKDKGVNVAQMKNAVNLLQQEGIMVSGSLIIFTPNEQVSDLDDSYRFGRWLSTHDNLYMLWVNPAVPLPGTDLWVEAIRQKTINLNRMKWEDLFVINHSMDKPFRIFYRTSLSPDTLLLHWQKFQKLSLKIHARTMKRFHLESANRRAAQLNHQLDQQVEKARIRDELHLRLNNFFRHPLTSIKRILLRPHRYRYLIADSLSALK